MSQELLTSHHAWPLFEVRSRIFKSAFKRILAQYGLLIGCLLVIISVSIFDTYLVYRFRDHIVIDEKNPICLTLIKYDAQNLTWFLWGKFLGNLFVASMLVALFRFSYRHTNTVSMSVACFQICLLVYLFCSDHTTGVLHFEGLFSQGKHEFRVAHNAMLLELVGLIVIGVVFFAIYHCYRLNLEARCQNALDETPLN